MSPRDVSAGAQEALIVLGRNPAFRGVTAVHLADIGKHARSRQFAAGEELMHQGAVSDCVHIVVDGTVRVEMSDGAPKLLAQLGPGDVVGEMGVLTGEVRSATVTAISNVNTLELTAEELLGIFKEDHILLLSFISVMHDRLQGSGA